MGPTLTATLEESLEKRRLAHNDRSEFSLHRVLILVVPSQSTTYSVSNLTATPRGVSERWRLAQNDRSKHNLHQVLTLMTTRASQYPIVGPTLTVTLRGVV